MSLQEEMNRNDRRHQEADLASLDRVNAKVLDRQPEQPRALAEATHEQRVAQYLAEQQRALETAHGVQSTVPEPDYTPAPADEYDAEIAQRNAEDALAVLNDQLAAKTELSESLERMAELGRDSLEELKSIDAELDSAPEPVGIDLAARRDILAGRHRDTYQELYRLEGALRELDAILDALNPQPIHDQPATTAEEK